ncbi:MAG: hypothetical protein V3U40_07040, partial [Candidatus Scalindua sediminis]
LRRRPRAFARPPSIRRLRAKDDENAKWIPSEALAKEGYLIASADFALPDKWQAGVLLVPRVSPVGAPFIIEKSNLSTR